MERLQYVSTEWLKAHRAELMKIIAQIDKALATPNLSLNMEGQVPTVVTPNKADTDSLPLPLENRNGKPKYKIGGSGPGEVSYAEVAWRHLLKPEFTLREGWDVVLEHLADPPNPRGMDGLRQSLYRDKRFTSTKMEDGRVLFKRKPQ